MNTLHFRGCNCTKRMACPLVMSSIRLQWTTVVFISRRNSVLCRKHSGQLMSERHARKLHAGLSPVAAVRQALADSTLTYNALCKALSDPWQAFATRCLDARSCTPHDLKRRVESCSWVGSHASVTQSLHAQHVGRAGVVIWVSGKLLHLVGADQRVICIHRASSEVEIALPLGIQVSGRPSIVLRGQELPATADGTTSQTGPRQSGL